jgi:hypothetical protein
MGIEIYQGSDEPSGPGTRMAYEVYRYANLYVGHEEGQMRDRFLFRAEAIAAGLSGLLFLLTLAWPDWIEGVFGVDPDHHNATFEWVIVAGLLAAATTFGYLARRKWVAVRRAQLGSRVR